MKSGTKLTSMGMSGGTRSPVAMDATEAAVATPTVDPVDRNTAHVRARCLFDGCECMSVSDDRSMDVSV